MARKTEYYKRMKVVMSTAEDEQSPDLTPKRPGRKGKGVPATGQVTVSIYLLHRIYDAMDYAYSTTDNPAIKRRMVDPMRDLYDRVGDALLNPKKSVLRRSKAGRPAAAIQVVLENGTVNIYETTTAAAEALGMRMTTLSVALSKGNGLYKRRGRWDAASESYDTITITRVVKSADGWTPETVRLTRAEAVAMRLEQDGEQLELKKTKYRRKPTPEDE